MNNIKNQLPIGSINRLFASTCCLMITLFVGVQLAVAQPLTNEEVVKLSSLGLGDEVVIAKIKQTPGVAFALAPRFSVNDPNRWIITLQERGLVAGVFAAVVG